MMGSRIPFDSYKESFRYIREGRPVPEAIREKMPPVLRTSQERTSIIVWSSSAAQQFLHRGQDPFLVRLQKPAHQEDPANQDNQGEGDEPDPF